MRVRPVPGLPRVDLPTHGPRCAAPQTSAAGATTCSECAVNTVRTNGACGVLHVSTQSTAVNTVRTNGAWAMQRSRAQHQR